jgi:competence protein ComEA
MMPNTRLVDGEQIRIPVPGEAVVPADGSASRGTPGGGGGGGKVSLNAADASALDSLPGVGEVLAGRILAWRQEHGRFSTVEELGEVSGIGEKLLTQLTPLVTL